MNFNDAEKNSVKSLLALLRTTQDASPTTGLPQHTSSGPGTTSLPPTNANPGGPPTGLPSQSQLNDLLSSLNGSQQNAPATPGSSAFSGPKHNLLEPFGPVGQQSRPPINYHRSSGSGSGSGAYDPFNPTGTGSLAVEPPAESGRNGKRPEWDPWTRTGDSKDDERASGVSKGDGSGVQLGRNKRARMGDPKFGEMSFKEALPILSELLEDDTFLKEIKKMKVEQDTLERRLWARQEKLKAEHDAQVQAEKDIARIARKPITPEKQAEWKTRLDGKLQVLYKSSFLPSIDGLSKRQREKLQQLGVPGLKGDESDSKVRERIRRIMEVLEVALED